MTIPDDFILSCLAPYNVPVSVGAMASIRQYIDLLLAWNRRMSLTSIVDTGEILRQHFGESLFAAKVLPIEHGRLADIGSGGGFPGIPLKLASPEIVLTLIESNVKRSVFLSELSRRLRLNQTHVLHSRYEDVVETTDKFDFIVARALGEWPSLLKWAQLNLVAGGSVVLWLGKADANLLSKSPGWSWRSLIPIPRSRNRVLLAGQPRS